MKERVKKILCGPILSSICYLALGLVLVLLPVESVSLISKVVFGVVMILAGVYHIVIHFWGIKNATILDLFSGVVLLVLGVFLFMNPLIVVKLFPTLLGAMIIADSLWMLKVAFRLKKLKRGIWKFVFLISLVFVALGVVLIVNPFIVVKYMVFFAGGTLIANGLTDLIFGIILLLAERNVEKQEKQQENMDLSSETQEEKKESETPVYEAWNSHPEEMDENVAFTEVLSLEGEAVEAADGEEEGQSEENAE